jgi:hypothetical protein
MKLVINVDGNLDEERHCSGTAIGASRLFPVYVWLLSAFISRRNFDKLFLVISGELVIGKSKVSGAENSQRI